MDYELVRCRAWSMPSGIDYSDKLLGKLDSRGSAVTVRDTMRIPIALILLLVVGCGSESEPEPETRAPADTHEDLAAETIEVMEQYVEALEKVTDAATAEANRPRIEELRAELRSLMQRKEALGELTPEQTEALVEKYGERLQVLSQRQGQIGMRFAKEPEIQAILRPAAPETPDAAAD